MAPLSLKCPLCCKETFSSHISLKYHLLTVIDNLLCPSCNKRCDNILDMANHLGRECEKMEPKVLEKNLGSIETNLQNTSEIVKEVDLVKIKTETEENPPELEESEANKIIDIDEQGNINEGNGQIEESIHDDQHMMYTCQMCNISFNSIQEHLAKYHEGEEVLLETDEHDEVDNIQNYSEDESLFVDQDDLQDDNQFEEYSNIITENENSVRGFENAAKSSKGSNLPVVQSISEEQLVDKDGIAYTRRIIKVGTDWMDEIDTLNSRPEPSTEKYIVEGTQVRKITGDEASQITDKSRIIEIHSCPNCLLQFPNISHYKKHKCTKTKQPPKQKLVKIKEELKYQCTFCQAVYSSLIALNDHMKAHLVLDETGMVVKKTVTMALQVCQICNTKFPSFKQLRLHSRMHEPVKSKAIDPPVSYNIMGRKIEESGETNARREMFHCEICEKMYDKEYEEVHLKSHAEQEDNLCLVCNRKFDTKENLEMHMKAHSNSKKFACSYCKKSFTNYPALEDHVLVQCTKRQYECQYCGRRFARPHEKVKHERIHTGEKPHICQICGKAFRVSYCLTLHMRTHSGTRPYSCSHCGKRFKSHSVFNHHMLTHSELRNYKCPYCPKAFKTSVQLAGHKNSHTKPFSCTECNRPFASLYAVRAHMETHKRDNNLKFDCWLCGASYARSFALRDHMNSAHGDENISDSQNDNNILMELDNSTDVTQMKNKIDDQITTEDQVMTENEEDPLAENGEKECEVIQNNEEGNEDNYVVLESGHEVGSENNIEVVEGHD